MRTRRCAARYVTADFPEPKDLETWLEVGSWSWNWMEPPLGQASFFLLCLQYSRDQMKNIGMKPYTEWLKERRAAKKGPAKADAELAEVEQMLAQLEADEAKAVEGKEGGLSK